MEGVPFFSTRRGSRSQFLRCGRSTGCGHGEHSGSCTPEQLCVTLLTDKHLPARALTSTSRGVPGFAQVCTLRHSASLLLDGRPSAPPDRGAIEVDMSTTAAYANVPELAVRTLACAVIKQALADALDPTTPPAVRRDAEEFLSGDAWFRRWCVAAGMRPTSLITRRHAA